LYAGKTLWYFSLVLGTGWFGSQRAEEFFISQQQGNKMSDMHKYNENS